jgi:hypothetical protein
MNGARKFHSPDGPAFNPGEQWVGSSGTVYQILSTRRYGPDKWDVDVLYFMVSQPQTVWDKDAWNFQVRCTHRADLAL